MGGGGKDDLLNYNDEKFLKYALRFTYLYSSDHISVFHFKCMDDRVYNI